MWLNKDNKEEESARKEKEVRKRAALNQSFRARKDAF